MNKFYNQRIKTYLPYHQNESTVLEHNLQNNLLLHDWSNHQGPEEAEEDPNDTS